MRDRICVALDAQAKDDAWITVSYFECPATKRQLTANNTIFSPYSPYTGQQLKAVTKLTSELPVREIRSELINVGTCTTCASQHYMFANEAKKLLGKRLHCTICSQEIEVPTDLELKPKVDPDDAADKDTGADTRTKHDKELRAAGDDDDDDNDNNNNDDNNDDKTADAGNGGGAAAPITDPGNSTPGDGNKAPPAATNKPDQGANPAKGTEQTDLGKADDDDDDDDNDNNNNDDDTTSELVSAAAKEFVLNLFAHTGGVQGKVLQFVPISKRVAYIFADDNPVIKLEADKATGDNAELFNDEEKLGKAIKAIIDHTEKPTPDSFAALGGTPVTYAIKVADEIRNRIQSGITAVTAGLQHDRSQLSEEWRACLSIASLIINKGVDRNLPNPLADALIANMKKIGIRRPQSVITQAFTEAADNYASVLLDKAQELTQQPTETRNQIARFVEHASYSINASDESSSDNHRKQYIRDSVPLNTPDNSDEEENSDNKSRRESEPLVASTSPEVEHFRQLLRR